MVHLHCNSFLPAVTGNSLHSRIQPSIAHLHVGIVPVGGEVEQPYLQLLGELEAVRGGGEGGEHCEAPLVAALQWRLQPLETVEELLEGGREGEREGGREGGREGERHVYVHD